MATTPDDHNGRLSEQRHHHHRHPRLSVAPPPPIPISRFYPSFPSSPFPATPSSAPTPSKRRRFAGAPAATSSSSLSSLFLLLFSLRSLYSLLPFIRSTPTSFSLFPFSFLVSLLSFALSLLVAQLPHSPDPVPLSLRSLTLAHLRPLAAKSALLTLVFLLRFQSLRYLGAAATILADLSGALVAKFLSDAPHFGRRIRGLAALITALSLLSYSWDRTGCFPLSTSPPPAEGCNRVLPIMLPFLSGFLGFYERASSNWGSIRQLGRKRVRVLSLALTTAMLFIPASISFFMAEGDEDAVSFRDLGWPLINTVIFGVILSENGSNEKVLFSAKDFRRDFLVTFFCTLLLELFYFPKLSLPGFLFCGFLLWVSVWELGSSSLSYIELGGSDPSETLYSMVMKPIRHILSERKSRKIALFLLINTAYMVVEFVAGFMSNSLGLISDACHMLFDCAALAIGLYASYISRLPANNQFNYGRGRFEVLSGYVNAVLLVLVGVLIVLESFERILDPQEISTNSLLAVSVGGLMVNVVGLVFFHEEHHHAHGGGGTCSHSHSHSHSHPHSHSPHHHHHDHHDHSVGHAQEHHVEHHAHCLSHSDSHSHSPNHHHHDYHDHTVGHGQECHVDAVSYESSNGHSHGAHSHHSCNQDDHHHDQKDECRSANGLVRIVGHGQVHDHEHDHSCHTSKGDHQACHMHQCSIKGKHGHGELDICSSSGGFEGHAHNVCHSEMESRSHKEPENSHHSNHSLNLSSPSKESSGKGITPTESRKHRHIDHNMEGIFLHVLADTMGSVGVVISTLLIKYKGWLVADPACSIFISIMIVSSVIPLLRNSAEILLQRVPRTHEQDLRVALDDLTRISGVCRVQNVHIWNFTNTEIVGTLHLQVSAETDKAYIKKRASDLLHEAGIKDVTIQVEAFKG